MNSKVDLKFEDFLAKLNTLDSGQWVIVYSEHIDDSEKALFYSALIPTESINKSLSDASWDLQCGDFTADDDETDIRPIVFMRTFDKLKESYCEILEDFRHHFNLYDDRANKRFIFIDDCGDDEVVVTISDDEIKIKTHFVRQYLFAKKVRLALFFDIRRSSKQTIEELGIKQYCDTTRDDDYVYQIGVGNITRYHDEKHQSTGYIIGKKLISGYENDTHKKEFADFIIGIDKNGNKIQWTCNKQGLAKSYEENPSAPYYLTNVYFDKRVLYKYFSQPTKYSVEANYLSCGEKWGMHIDNDRTDSVMVYLGDIGSILPYKEQLYWKSFNISPCGTISQSKYSQDFLCDFHVGFERSDLCFWQKFELFQDKWKKHFGWSLFKPLYTQDEHLFKTLHIPLTNEQKEFDEQIFALAKVLVDSLNEQELCKGLTSLKENTKGIDKLEAFISSKVPSYNNELQDAVRFFRNLQQVRSTGVAHRKGTNYRQAKKRLDIKESDLAKSFENILQKCIEVFDILDQYLLHS